MDDDQYIDQIFEEHRKKKRVAYLLWLFLGWFGVHRFYAGRTKSGIAQLLLTLTGVGFALVTLWWWLIDAVLVPDMVNDYNRRTLDMIHGQRPRQDDTPQPRRIEKAVDARRQAMLEELRRTGYRKDRPDEFARLYR